MHGPFTSQIAWIEIELDYRQWLLVAPCISSLSAICSQVVSPRVLGEAQGVLASMKAFMEGVGPLAFATAMTVAEGSVLPGSPWLIGAACMSVSVLLCLRLERAVQSANGLDEPEQVRE